MSLTPHVTNYELSKRLKEIGCPQKSLFWWQATYSHPLGYRCTECKENAVGDISPHPCSWHLAFYDDGEEHFDISAFLASELEEWLPYENENWCIDRKADGYDCKAREIGGWKGIASTKTLPDAMGEMVVYLKENGLIKF